MSVSMQGIGKEVATFRRAGGADGYTATLGRLVKLSAAGVVTDCGDGDKFIGVCVATEGEHAAVQIGGCAAVPIAAASPPTAVGYAVLSADGDGKLKTNATGRELLVLEVSGDSAAILL